MRTHLDCLPCLVRQALDSARFATRSVTLQEWILCDVLRSIAEMDLHQSPPLIAQHVHRIIRRATGMSDPYRAEKERSTALALTMYPVLASDMESANDPLEAAVRMAIAGNVIDLGISSSLDERAIWEAISHAWTAPLNADPSELRSAANGAESILYLADNAGELVFDRFLIECLGPEKVTVVVKGSPVLNDATMVEAEASGLTGWVEVIDNGSDAPGTILADCDEEFRHRFNLADLVIAKGQGNWESLSNVPKDIFFILKAKCPVIARSLGCEVGSLVLRRAGHRGMRNEEGQSKAAC